MSKQEKLDIQINEETVEQCFKPLDTIRNSTEAQEHNKYGNVCISKTPRSITFFIQDKRIYGEPDPELKTIKITPSNVSNLPKITQEEVDKYQEKSSLNGHFYDIFTIDFSQRTLVIISDDMPQGTDGHDIDHFGPFTLQEDAKNSNKFQRTDLSTLVG